MRPLLHCLLLALLLTAPAMPMLVRPARAAVPDDQVYTRHDIAGLLQVDPSTVGKWIQKGLLRGFRTPDGQQRVRAGDLRTFLVAQHMPIPDELDGTFRLLAVDDDRAVLDVYKRAFKPHATKVDLQTTTSGVEALVIVSERRPRALLVDRTMPDIDGLEVIRRIRARRAMDSVRLILVADTCSPELVAQSKSAGALACMTKPLDVQRVLETLGLGSAATPPGSAATPPGPAATPPGSAPTPQPPAPSPSPPARTAPPR